MGFFPQMCSSVLCSNKAKLCSYKDSIPFRLEHDGPYLLVGKSSEVKTWGFSYMRFFLSSSGRTLFFLRTYPFRVPVVSRLHHPPPPCSMCAWTVSTQQIRSWFRAAPDPVKGQEFGWNCQEESSLFHWTQL